MAPWHGPYQHEGKLAPLADHFHLFTIKRGHGRSDHSTSEFGNLRTWANDRCCAICSAWPVVTAAFGGRGPYLRHFFPGHAGATSPGQHDRGTLDYRRSVDIPPPGWRRAAAVAERDFAELSEESLAGLRVCGPLQQQAPVRRRTPPAASPVDPDNRCQPPFPQRGLHFSPWSMLDRVRSPVLILAGEDDPMCPLPVVETWPASFLQTRPAWCLKRVPGTASSATGLDLAFPAIEDFIRRVKDGGGVSDHQLALRRGDGGARNDGLHHGDIEAATPGGDNTTGSGPPAGSPRLYSSHACGRPSQYQR